MSTALIVSVLGLAGLTVLRIERKQMDVGSHRDVARMHANSAVELALRVIADDPSWRTNHTNGVETTPQSLGAGSTGTLSWILEDSDGSLSDADTDLRLKGIGRVGNTVQVSSVKLSAQAGTLDSLQCSVYSVGNMNQSSNSTTNSGPFATAGTLTVSGNLYGDVEGNPVNVTGTGYVSGTITDPGPSRGMPSSAVWDTYVPLATPILYTSFTYIDATTRNMERKLLGATVNPFGSPDPQGVYLIQVPAGQQLTIRMSRIHATLLIELGANASFKMESSCLWDPPLGANYPALIVKSDWSANVTLNSSNAKLKEGNPDPKMNFNPAGEPYDGVSDTDENDQYPALCRGLYHVIGANVHTYLSSNLNIQGVVITEGTMALGANLDVTLDPSLYSNPPLGYTAATGDVESVSGSWLWEAAP